MTGAMVQVPSLSLVRKALNCASRHINLVYHPTCGGLVQRLSFCVFLIWHVLHFTGSRIISLVLVWLPYTLLVEVGVLFTTLPALLQVAIFLYLRRAQPNMLRPYKVRTPR
jgi:hypothetical protein